MATKTKKKRKSSAKKKTKKTNINMRFIAPAVAVLLIIAISATIIALHNNPTKENPFPNATSSCLRGVDVSHHNGKINWKNASKELDFAIVRVGARGYAVGEILKDERAKENLAGANKNNIPVGVYFYTQAITPKEAADEARYALKVIKGYDIQLPIFIDFEYAYNKKGKIDGRLYKANLTKEENTKIINAFCEVVEKAGYQCGVYASTYVYESKLVMKKLNKNCFIWVADYNKGITYDGDYDIWQYSSRGKISSISKKRLDLNYWYI